MSRRVKANGEGTVTLRKDGRWEARLYVNEADGRRVRRFLYGRSRKDVETKLIELRTKADVGVPMTPSQLTVESYLREWLSQIAAPRVRPNTLAAYSFQIERYLVPDLGSRRLGKLTAREVRVYLDQLKRRGVGVRTIRYVHATLRAALEDALREELLEKNVVKLVRPPAAPRTEHQPFSVEETKAFLKSNADDRLYAMLVVFGLLGLRRSEVLGLRWEDVDLTAGMLLVRRGLHRIDGHLQVMETKTARSRRTIPLPVPVVTALVKHQAAQVRERVQLAERWPDSGFVFTSPIGTPIDPDNCSKLVRAAMKRAGVRVVRLHDLRHGVVSVLLGLGVPPRTVMEIAGHTGLEMTMNVYGHVTLDDKREALDRLGDLLRGDR